MKNKYFAPFSELKKELLKDPDAKKEYDLLEPEFKAIGELIELRIKSKMTQGQLAKKLGTKQSAVSRFEKNLQNPTVYSLAKLASVFGKKLVISLK